MATFTHTPAHSTYVPDEYTDEVTGETFTVEQDDSGDDPRGWVESELASVYIYRAARGYRDDNPDDFRNVAVDAFAHYYARDWDEGEALKLTRRYLAAYHPKLKIACDTFSVTGYSQGDWVDIFVAVANGYGTPEGHADTYERYFRGDVWVVSNGEDSLGGIYAESQEEAIEAFKANY